MKLCFKGFAKNTDVIPENNLPKGAVPFKEPKSIEGATLISAVFSVIALALIFLLSLLLGLVRNFNAIDSFFNLYGLALFFITIIPHEILHAVCYPKEAEVNIYILPKKFCACIWSASPVSKRRFVIMSIFPYLILSVLPVLILFIIPHEERIVGALIGLASYSSIGCGVDLFNAFAALTQMPPESKEVLSKINSYWYK